MPLYPLQKCRGCGFTGDVLARVADVDKLKCPCCGAAAEQDYAQKRIGNGNREFHGEKRESLSEFYHSSEVAEARRELGKSGECVRADGVVVFKDRAQQRQYAKDKRAMVERFGVRNVIKRERAKRVGVEPMPKRRSPRVVRP